MIPTEWGDMTINAVAKVKNVGTVLRVTYTSGLFKGKNANVPSSYYSENKRRQGKDSHKESEGNLGDSTDAKPEVPQADPIKVYIPDGVPETERTDHDLGGGGSQAGRRIETWTPPEYRREDQTH